MEFPSIAIEDLDMSKITITLKKNQDVKQKVKYAYINYSDFGYKSFGITLPTIDIYTYGYYTTKNPNLRELGFFV